MSKLSLRLVEFCSGLAIGALSLLLLMVSGVNAFWAAILSLTAWAMGWLLTHGFVMTSKGAGARSAGDGVHR
jgi:hypothetical protein